MHVTEGRRTEDVWNACFAIGLSFFHSQRKRVVQLPSLGLLHAAMFTFAMGFAMTALSVEPVIHWTFDGGAATNSGSGGAAYDATLTGTVAFTNGIDGGGLCFLGGSQGYAKLSYTYGSQGTVAFWYKPARFYNYNSVFDNSVNSENWEMWIYQDGRLRARINNTDSSGVEYDLDNLNGSNQWYHVAFVWDNVTTNQTRLYIDGVERAKGTIMTWIAPGNAVYFGGHTGNMPAEGVLDDVRVYDTALTAEQVQAVQTEIAAQAPVVRIAFDGAVTNGGTGGAMYDATVSGDTVWTNGWNNKGQAFALFDTNDFVSVPYRLPTSGSIALWYYVSGPWYNHNSLFDNSVNANHYECWIDVNGTLAFRPAGNTWPQAAICGLGNGSNRWYHIVGTWDAVSSNIVLYVNGVERGRAVNTNGVAWPTAGSNFYVGGGNAGNTNGKGTVSDFQIFETALTSNRVAEIYGEFGRRGGLVAYVPFDGTAADVAGSNAVVVTGSPVYVKTQGGFLKGLSCGGVGTSDNASISNVLGSSVGTIALWYYARGPWYNYQTVIDNPIYQEYWESWIYSDGRLAFRVSNLIGGGLVVYDLDNLRGPDNWYHIAYVWDRAAQQTKLYVDGVLRATATLSEAGWVDPSSTLYLAGGHPSNSKGNGIWDEVRVYDRALAAEEIVALTVIPPPPPPSGTLIKLL